MPPHALDEFLGQVVQPFLRGHGYRKRARAFRWLTPSGDYSVIQFRTWPGHPRWSCFLADYGYVVHKPRPYLPLDFQKQVALNPPAYKGQLQLRIDPPSAFKHDNLFSPNLSAWALAEPAEREPMSTVLIEILRDQLIPIIRRIVAGERNAEALTAPNLIAGRAVAPFERAGSQLETPIFGNRDWLGDDHVP